MHLQPLPERPDGSYFWKDGGSMNQSIAARQVSPLGVSQDCAERLTMDDIGNLLARRYEVRGWSRHLFINDWALLRRVGVHPADITTHDLERVVLRAKAQGTKANYVWRLRSLMQAMRELGVCDNNAAEGLPTIRKPKAVPRPLTDAEASLLMHSADEPFRAWFVLGCMAGLRAMEVSGLKGADLEDGPAGWMLRVRGKGGTDLTIPAHEAVVQVIQDQRLLGRLWRLNPNKVSDYACKEMKRLGVEKKFHACRHWHATALLAATNGDIVTTARLLRHGTVTTTMGYARLAEDKPRAAIARLSLPLTPPIGQQLVA